MKKNKQYIISFLIPIIIFLMVCSIANINFWGTKNFIVSDSRAQYISLFSYLKEVLKGNASLFYSFSKGMGGSMFGTFAYYLASPLNLLIIFFSKKALVSGMLLILTLKIGLSGLTMFSYLKRKYNRANSIYIFSTSYALMGYVVVYFFNIMWLDAIYLAPLLLIGIDKIIEGKKSLFYGIVLFMAIFSNYYTGYMLCVFSCLYFSYQLLLNYKFKEDKDKIISSIIKFLITSILAGFMTSVLLLPSFYELFINVGRGVKTSSHITVFNGDFLKIFSRFYMWSHNSDNVLNFGTVAIYSGVIILPLVYFYFVNKNIKVKERILTGIFLTLLISGLFILPIDFFWHGLSNHNSFDYRYSYLISLFLIIIACKSFYNIKGIDLKHYLLFLVGYLILSNLVILQQYNFLTLWSVYVSVGLIILYLLLFYFYNRVCNKEKRILKFLLIILVLSELFVNFYLSIYKHKFDYKMEYNDWVEVVGVEVDKITPSTDFYRIEKELNYSSIDSILLDYNGVSTFLSTINEKSRQIINNVGHHTAASTIAYNFGASIITDSMFGIKYFIARNNNLDYEVIDSFKFSSFNGILFNELKSDVFIYENDHALSLGYMVNNKVKDFINIFSQGKIINVFEVQNYMLNGMVNSKDSYFKPYNISIIDDNNFNVSITNDEDLYIIVPVNIKGQDLKISIYINDEQVHVYNYYRSGIFKIRNKYLDSVVNLRIESEFDQEYIPSVYYFDKEMFAGTIDELKKNQMDIINQEKNYIKGKINVYEDKDVLFTTIPYERGWTIKVDGKKIDYYSVYDAFIGIDLDVGEHEIEFKFEPPLFKLGLIITFISSVLFALYMKFEKEIIDFFVNIYDRYEEIINYLIAGGLTTVVSIGTYGLFAKIFNINYIASTVLSFVFAVIFAYFVNKVFVFKTDFSSKKMVIKETYQFMKYRILSLVIDVTLMILFVELLQIDDLIAKIIVQVVIVVANYFFSKIFIFKK
ncbi:MAG: YfhO family protein [Bacilli bacterium]|nr:YfhO family protein [Bacilli bacterium]